ncbi:SHOCT domain-containing protein [Tellurirhabdus bombi]|uniref:SHOCT domain-containing protein n=1 Tax=Tellurirhabdus bombi TaxID=2907205 RepID=UPI001F402BE1|nr:SHOCT domain-containing protein [Tellurirhabdus bombi]
MKKLYLALFVLLSTITFAQKDSVKHEVLDKAEVSGYYNIHFWVPEISTDPKQIEAVAQSLVNQYCSGSPGCNGVYFWKTRDAYQKLMFKRNELTIDKYDYNKDKWLKAEDRWKKANWKYVCENLYADFTGVNTINELSFFPYYDDDYRKYGGKKKRPEIRSTRIFPVSSVEISTDPVSQQKPKGSATGVLVVTLTIAIGLVWWVIRNQNKKSKSEAQDNQHPIAPPVQTQTKDIKEWKFGMLGGTIWIENGMLSYKSFPLGATYPLSAVQGVQYNTSLGVAEYIVLASGGKNEKVSIRKSDQSKQTIQEINDYIANWKRSQQSPIAATSSTNQIADEIQKLANLRDSGILTEAEFQEQKQKLLSR